MEPKICVLIPSFNEARTIGAIVAELKIRGMSVFVVDDGSADDTAAVASSAGATVIRQGRNKGKGAALREGIRQILAKDFDGVVLMDGDGQHDIGEIDKFLKKAKDTGADMVIGNRMADSNGMPAIRVMTNRFMSWLISAVSGRKVPDTQCGFRFLRRSVLEAVKLESSRFQIESEMIILAARKCFKIESVPIVTIYQDEKSRINPFIDTMRFIWFILKMGFKPKT